MNAQNWNNFQKHDILASHHQYYIQVQIYMAYMDLKSYTLRGLKSKGEGIQGSQLLGRNTIYPIDEFIAWLDENVKIID